MTLKPLPAYRLLALACYGAVAACPIGLATPVLAQTRSMAGCGNFTESQGPYDYRNERYWVKYIEDHHFTPPVEALVKSVSGYIGGDIDYLLRYVPNHHRALVSMTRLFERGNWKRPDGTSFDIECYYIRAVNWRPDDAVVHSLYAIYMAKRSRREEAIAELGQAVAVAGDNAFSHYNIGLVYLDLQQYDKALEQAHKAQALGFTRPDLKERLRAAGRWKEPEDGAQATALAASAARQ